MYIIYVFVYIYRKGPYHKRIRDGLRHCQFCPCWYDTFEDGFRIMQFGYCPGTTQFALKFTRNGDRNSGSTQSFESRSRFATNIDMNIASSSIIQSINMIHVKY